MPRPKKRPWFQLRLSTGIVLMFMAGGLLWANMRVDPASVWKPPVVPEGVMMSPPDGVFETHGWPWTAYAKPDVFSMPVWFWKGLAGDILVSVAILVFAAMPLELLCRRRE